MSRIIEGALEIDNERGVIWFHATSTADNKYDSGSVLRICCLPTPIPTKGHMLDIAHMQSVSWKGHEHVLARKRPVWSDEPCDRTEGHRSLSEVFLERYGIPLADWEDKKATTYDGGDAFFSIGYVDTPNGLLRIEVIQACDGNSIWELR